MNIVMICDFFSPDLDYQENLMLKYLVKAGHKVTVIASTFESISNYLLNQYDVFESKTRISKMGRS